MKSFILAGGAALALIAHGAAVSQAYPSKPVRILIPFTAGRIQYWLSPTGPAVGFVKDGRVLALAVTTAQRSPAFPDVPTVAEAGLPGFDYDLWYGVFTPGKTPRAVVRQVNQAISQIVDLPELKKPMLAQGVLLKSSSAEAFHKLVAEDIGKLSKIVKAAGIKVD